MLYKEHFKIKLSIPAEVVLPTYINRDLVGTMLFDANIFYSTNRHSDFKIQILVEPNSHSYFLIEHLICLDINILKFINPASEHEHFILNFENSNIIHFDDDRGKWENDMQYFTITIDQGELIANAKTIIPPAAFSITHNGIWLIDKLFSYEGFNYLEPNKLESIEKNPQEITFDNYIVRFKVEFELFTEENINEWNIIRWPQMIVSNREQKIIEDISKLKEIADILFVLISFYQNQVLYYTYARIDLEYQFLDILKTSKKIGFIEPPPSRFNENGISVYDFINSCNSDLITKNVIFIEKIIKRYIYSESLEGELKFMVLYNILEQIRNFYIKHSKEKGEGIIVVDEYEFVESKTKTNKIIEAKIKEISSIVKDDEKQAFENDAYNKVTFIRKILMQNQFVQFFNYLDLKIENYNLDLDGLLKIRHKLVHGHPLAEDESLLEEKNLNMRNLVFDIIHNLLKSYKYV